MSAHPFVFGVYAGGGNGEISSAPKPTASAVNQRLRELAGQAPFVVHLYTAWSWYNPTDLDQQVQQFRDAGLGVVLTVKYSPPAGHDGDVAGYEAFVRSVVDRYGTAPALSALVIGNEANVSGNPGSSDGPFARSHEAVVRGVIAAHEELQRLHSSARVGVNFAVTDSGSDGSFLSELAKIGGPSFASSIQFVGIDVYPGIWPVGTGRPYADMRDDLAGARASVDSVAELRGKPIDILEVGAPVVGEQEQVDRLTQFVQACLDNREALNITSFIWFDLWDANSQSSSPYAHYGLLHSDLGDKPAFQAFQRAVTAGS